MYSSRRADDDLGSVLERLHVISYVGSADASVALDVHKVTNGDNDFLDLLSEFSRRSEDERLARFEIRVDFLEAGDGEGRRLARAGLGLCDDIGTYRIISIWRSKDRKSNVLPLMTGMMARC